MERMGHALITATSDRVDFTVVAAEGLDSLPSGVRTIHVSLPSAPAFARIAWFFVRSRRVVRQERHAADIVHACGALTPEPVDIATVHLCHAAVEKSARRQEVGWRRANAAIARRLGLGIERRQYRRGRVGQLVAVSPVVNAQLEQHYGDIPRRVIVNGVDATAFSSVDRPPHASDVLRVIMVTGDFALKGVDLAIAAICQAPHASLTVVGDGPIGHYERILHDKNVADRVRFTGFVADVAPLYREHDVVLCVSNYEAFGLYLVEGALCGCAVVSTAVGVADDLVGANEGGRLVTAEATSVSDALEELWGSPTTRRALADVAQLRARSYTRTAMADAYVDLYHEKRS